MVTIAGFPPVYVELINVATNSSFDLDVFAFVLDAVSVERSFAVVAIL